MKLSFSDTSGGVDGVEADVDDPGPNEGPPSNAQHYGAEICWFEYRVLAVLVHQGEALGRVQTVEGGHGQSQQEEEEQAEVETLSHQGRLVQVLFPFSVQQSIVVVVIVGEDTGERVQD